jgi:hypothetical protein
MLFTITAQLTAVAELGKSYSQTISSIGKSFVQDDTSSAVDSGVGFGKYAIHLCHSLLSTPGSPAGLYAQSRRIGK